MNEIRNGYPVLQSSGWSLIRFLSGMRSSEMVIERKWAKRHLKLGRKVLVEDVSYRRGLYGRVSKLEDTAHGMLVTVVPDQDAKLSRMIR